MPTRIEKLTPEQKARFGEFVERWTAVGLSTEPADRPRAERAVREAYAIAGLPAPGRIVWCGSPFGQGLTRAAVTHILGVRQEASVWASVGDSVEASVGASVEDSVWASVGDSVEASVWASVEASVRSSVRSSVRDSVRSSVGDSVEASVWASVEASVRSSVRDSVWASVRDSVEASVGAPVRDSVRSSVGDSVWSSVRDSVWASGYGQHDASWISFFSFFREACGLRDQTDCLQAIAEITESAGWWLPHERICWISERHNVLCRDANRRLHCESGPAVAYPDGWSIWAWHGVRVPREVIEAPDTLTVEQIKGERNTEVRRVMVERFGRERFLRESGATLAQEDDYGRLWRAQMPDEDLCLVEVVNGTVEADGTRHSFFLGVPPECRTALEAVAWTYEMTADEYATGLMVRT